MENEKNQLSEEQLSVHFQVPYALKVGAGFSWRILVIGAFLYCLWRIFDTLSEISIPILVALLFTAAFWPIMQMMVRHRVPRVLAAGACVAFLVTVVIGIFTMVGTQIASQSQDLADEAVNSFNQLVAWINNGPLHLSNEQLNSYLLDLGRWIRGSEATIINWASQFGYGVGQFVTGSLLALFATFFFLYEGEKIFGYFAQWVTPPARLRLQDAFMRGWFSLVSYVRAAVVVALVNGFSTGCGAAVLGSNLFIAIGSFTFLMSFVPLLGSITSSLVAFGVVLVTLGWVKALIMMAIFIVVIEIEGNVLQPFLLGKAVSLHPLLVLFGIAAGMILYGIVGALIIVPAMAFGFAFMKSINPLTPPEEQPPDSDALPDSALQRFVSDAKQVVDGTSARMVKTLKRRVTGTTNGQEQKSDSEITQKNDSDS